MSNHDILIIGIENWTTGKRPDGIDNDDIRNGDLVAPAGTSHQRLGNEQYGDFEVREVRDGRGLSQYDEWTIHFVDGSSVSDTDGKQALADAIRNGKQPADVEGVIAIPHSEIDTANAVIREGLPAQYRGDMETVEQWAADNGVDLPPDRREKLQTAHEQGCQHVEQIEPPEL